VGNLLEFQPVIGAFAFGVAISGIIKPVLQVDLESFLKSEEKERIRLLKYLVEEANFLKPNSESPLNIIEVSIGIVYSKARNYGAQSTMLDLDLMLSGSTVIKDVSSV